MDISVKWFNDQFNVLIASKAGKEPFLEIKGCRIVQGNDGPFIGWPSTKNVNTGKYWKHVYGSEEFSAVVMQKAQASQPKGDRRTRDVPHPDDEDIPF